MDEIVVKKINLVDALAEEFAGVEEPSEGQVRAWTEDQIRQYYRSGGQPPASALPATADVGGKLPDIITSHTRCNIPIRSGPFLKRWRIQERTSPAVE